MNFLLHAVRPAQSQKLLALQEQSVFESQPAQSKAVPKSTCKNEIAFARVAIVGFWMLLVFASQPRLPKCRRITELALMLKAILSTKPMKRIERRTYTGPTSDGLQPKSDGLQPTSVLAKVSALSWRCL